MAENVADDLQWDVMLELPGGVAVAEHAGIDLRRIDFAPSCPPADVVGNSNWVQRSKRYMMAEKDMTVRRRGPAMSDVSGEGSRHRG